MTKSGIFTGLFALLIGIFSPAFSQLRMHSPYSQDQINPDQTGFLLHDNGAADFIWASEWSEFTAQSCTHEIAIFVWYFKDGTKAYSRQGQLIADFGQSSGYLLTQKASTLEDGNGNKIQPLTKNNYPIKIELWIGDFEDAKRYTLQSRVDYRCISATSIEANRLYHFLECPEPGS
jgi:hypothetical protein